MGSKKDIKSEVLTSNSESSHIMDKYAAEWKEDFVYEYTQQVSWLFL